MQPYFLPYVGYWQLLAAVDEFIVYDTVQFSSGGWVNRNRIRVGGEVRWLTVPVARAPLQTPIRERRIAADADWRDRMVRRATSAHPTAPHRDDAIDLLRAVIDPEDDDLTALLVRGLDLV
ncbi:MAG: WbqC family protein, partial [Actinomycetota bacterium]